MGNSNEGICESNLTGSALGYGTISFTSHYELSSGGSLCEFGESTFPHPQNSSRGRMNFKSQPPDKIKETLTTRTAHELLLIKRGYE